MAVDNNIGQDNTEVERKGDTNPEHELPPALSQLPFQDQPYQKVLLQAHIEDHLYDLHKRVWSSSEPIPHRVEIYASTVDSYRRQGFNVALHSRFVAVYRELMRRHR